VTGPSWATRLNKLKLGLKRGDLIVGGLLNRIGAVFQSLRLIRAGAGTAVQRGVDRLIISGRLIQRLGRGDNRIDILGNGGRRKSKRKEKEKQTRHAAPPNGSAASCPPCPAQV
jgi:hypothetical protein